MRRLKADIQKVIRGSGRRSYAGRRDLEVGLHRFGGWLMENYRSLSKLSSLKPRIIEAYVEHLKGLGLSTGSLKNNLSYLRSLAKGIGKPNIVHRTNAEYGIGSRRYYATRDRAAYPAPEEIQRIPKEEYRLAVEAQMLFGVRAQEALKFRVKFADRENYLAMLGSWCKGGRPRNLDVNNEAQRGWIRRVHEYADRTRNKSLIPKDKTLENWLRNYHDTLRKVLGIRSHDLRHGWAHKTYREMTGMEPRVCGGPGVKEMTMEQKESADRAYWYIADQLGHSRKYISSQYLGARR
ncbi:MAG: phage integrase N-terminal domain-containing protein [Candidatus Nitrospinota bacterium M3_3B_026]